MEDPAVLVTENRAGGAALAEEVSEQLDLRHGTFAARVRVRRMSPPSPRGRVVCLHGLSSEASEFRFLAEHLAADGFEVLYPDWIGHGDSQRFADPADYMWDRYVKMTWALDDIYGGPRTHYIGNSWGAAILFIAVVGGKMRLRSSTFIDVPVHNEAGLNRHSTYVVDVAVNSFPDIESAERFLFEQRPAFALMRPELKRYYREARFRSRDGAVRFAVDAKIAESARGQARTNFNITPHIHRLRNLALFIYGRKSEYRQPKLFELICRTQPNIAYFDDVDAGHPPSLQKQEEIAPILAFLRRVG